MAMSMLSSMPHTIYIGTSKRFTKGAEHVWKYELVPVGEDQTFLCQKPPNGSTANPQEVWFICRETDGDGDWWVVYVGRVEGSHLEQRSPMFRTQDEFWIQGPHEWQENAHSESRQKYEDDWVVPRWDSRLTVDTRWEVWRRQAMAKAKPRCVGRPTQGERVPECLGGHHTKPNHSMWSGWPTFSEARSTVGRLALVSNSNFVWQPVQCGSLTLTEGLEKSLPSQSIDFNRFHETVMCFVQFNLFAMCRRRVRCLPDPLHKAGCHIGEDVCDIILIDAGKDNSYGMHGVPLLSQRP